MSDSELSEVDCDVVVIGAGAAGLSAALVLARARRRVVVVDDGSPRNAPAAHMHGFLSRDGVAPSALLEIGRAEVAGYGAELMRGRVAGVSAAGRGFAVALDTGELRARAVVVATGLRDVLPDIPGAGERWGRDVLHCPYCHGYEVRDQPLGVLGTSPGAVAHALLIRQWSDDVMFFAHTLDLGRADRERLDARGVTVVEGAIERLTVRDDVLRGVELTDGSVVARSVVFVVPRMVPRDAVLTALGCAVGEGGWVVVDRAGRTSVPGVWAAGNVIDPRALVVISAGMGAAAGFAINLDLTDDDVDLAVRQRHAVEPAGGAGR